MRYMPKLGMALMATLIVNCGDTSGPPPPPPPPKVVIQITSGGGTFTVVSESPTVRRSLSGSISGAASSTAQWKMGSTVLGTGTLQLEYDFPAGTHTVCLESVGSGVPAECTTLTVVIVAPTFAMLTSRDTTVFKTSAAAVQVTYRAQTNADASLIVWKVNDVQRGTGATPTFDLSAGTHRVCGYLMSLSQCGNISVKLNGFPLLVVEARANGDEVLGAGNQACYSATSFAEECVSIASDGKVQVRPSFLEKVQTFRLWVRGPSIKSFVLDVTSDKFYSPMTVVLADKPWGDLDPSFIKAYENSSSSPPSLYGRTVTSQGLAVYDLGAFGWDVEIPVLLADASYVETSSQTWRDGEYTDIPQEELSQIPSILVYIAEEMGFVRFKSVSGSAWNACNSIVIRKNITVPASSAVPVRCNSTLPGLFTGGRITLAKSYQITAVKFVIAHEMGHVFGMGHTCGWVSIMNSGCFNSLDYTPEDKVYFSVYYKVVNLQRKYATPYGLAEMHQAERLEAGSPSIESYRVEF